MISFHNADVSFVLPKKRILKQFIQVLFDREGIELKELIYVFCSDIYLLRINKEFLDHATYTDVITFDLSTSDSIIGEIYISTDRITDNALTYKTNKQQEVRRVIFHGALHLCGYKDKKKSEITIMRHKEDEYLRLFDSYLTQ